jgi:hypothetical protein
MSMRWRAPLNSSSMPSCGRPFGLGAGVDAGTRQQVHRDLFEHAGADAPEHVVAALAFDDDVVDACLVQQLPEQKAGGAGADDRDLGAHVRVSVRVSPA